MNILKITQLLTELNEAAQELVETSTLNKKETEPRKEEKEFLSADEAAEFLGVTKRSLFNYREAGLPFHQIYRKILFKKADLIDFIEKHKVERRSI